MYFYLSWTTDPLPVLQHEAETQDAATADVFWGEVPSPAWETRSCLSLARDFGSVNPRRQSSDQFPSLLCLQYLGERSAKSRHLIMFVE